MVILLIFSNQKVSTLLVYGNICVWISSLAKLINNTVVSRKKKVINLKSDKLENIASYILVLGNVNMCGLAYLQS